MRTSFLTDSGMLRAPWRYQSRRAMPWRMSPAQGGYWRSSATPNKGLTFFRLSATRACHD